MKTKTNLLSLVLFLLFNNLLPAMDIPNTQTTYESNRIVIKFKQEYKSLLHNKFISGFRIPDLDRVIAQLKVLDIDLRFQFNPKKYKPGLPDLSLIYQIDYQKDISPYTAAEILMKIGYFDYAEPSFIDEIMAVPDDPLYASSSYLTALNASTAWDIQKGEDDSVGVILAIVDTGVNWKHADLTGNIWNNLGEDADNDSVTIYYTGTQWAFDPGDINGIDDDNNGKVDDLIGWDFMLNSSGDEGKDPIDAYGHGTTVAGLAGAVTNNTRGISAIPWNITLMPISCSYPGSSALYRGYDAIIYAAENGADAINYSAGSSSFSQANEDAIIYASGLGSIIVAAAGNTETTTILYPSGYPGVIAVTSVLNSGVKAPNRTYGRQIDVCVPTEGMYSTSLSGGYSSVQLASYTSYASPIAAGLTALIRSAHHDWTSEQVVNQLIATCIDVDAVNPGYANLLGDGMLNAYAALTEASPIVDQELRLGLAEVYAPSDFNGNLALEPDEIFSLNFKIRNYTHGVSADTVAYILSTSDSDIIITSDTYYGALPADGYDILSDAFACRVSATATTKAVVCTLTVVTDLPVTSGETMTFSLMINAGGVFVWEGKAQAGYSGRRIRDTLINQGHSVYYSTTFPYSFATFSAVFLSYGMVTTSGNNVTRFDRMQMYDAVRNYLMEGGRLYIEGNDAIGFDIGNYLADVGGGQSGADVLWPLLGIEDAEDGSNNGINSLQGQDIACTNDIVFTSTTQTKLESMDKYTPGLSAVTAFIESDYGNVAVQNYDTFGQKSFVFSYCLAELVDGSGASKRDSLLYRIMQDFTTSGATYIGVPEVIVSYVDSVTVKLFWSAVYGADYYSVYASEDPYGIFPDDWTLIITMTPDNEVYRNVPPVSPYSKFYRVTAHR